MTLFFHEIKRSIKMLSIWSGTVGAMILICMLMYPDMKSQMTDVEAMFANMGGFTAAFGMDRLSFGSLMGFYGVECGNMLGIGGSFFAALLGIEALAKEEANHTAEFLLTHPFSRRRIIMEKLLSVAAVIVIFDGICLVFSLVSFAVIGEPVAWRPFWLFLLSQLVLHMEIAFVCFGISAFVKRGSTGIGLGLAASLYFLNIFVNISDKAKFLKYITPFQYADAANVIPSESLDGGLILVGAAITLFCVGFGFFKYQSKDIAA